jgi:hypothetical protein
MLFLCYWRGDYERSALRIQEVLAEVFGAQEVFDANSPSAAGSDYRDDLATQVRRSEAFVVVIAPDWLDAVGAHGAKRDDRLCTAIESALRADKLVIPVLVDGARMPRANQLPPALQGIVDRQSLEIAPGGASREGLRELVAALGRHGPGSSHASAPPMPSPASPSGSWQDSGFGAATRSSPAPSYRSGAPVGSAHVPPVSSAPPGRPQRSGMLAGILSGLRTLWGPKPDASPSPVAPPADRVLLAASAPRSCPLGGQFTAALVAYVEEARTSALKKLADLGETGDRRIDDVAAGAWRTGAPVAVRLSGEGATVTPAEVRFEWSGRENLAAFSVAVGPAPRDAVVLSFQVLVADVLIAFVPMRVSLASSTEGSATQRAQGTVPSSAFASYSSQDAERVTQRLSTLSRWAPGLDIFQDCLDLTPGETFKPQLETQIARRDVFLLFWSRKAASSPWVRWEYTTALQRKGLGAILAMPLEDPAIAPPPPELADQHQRDRFMLAGYGLAKVREEAGRSGNV